MEEKQRHNFPVTLEYPVVVCKRSAHTVPLPRNTALQLWPGEKQHYCNNDREYGVTMIIELLSEMIQGEFNMILNGVNGDLEVIGYFSMGSVFLPAHLKYNSSLWAQ